ncbi:MAG: hypothetical protein NZ108_08425, partial [Bacteroidia bacterium]|nr:hypothetical protein [Bacteroidia bacterium]
MFFADLFAQSFEPFSGRYVPQFKEKPIQVPINRAGWTSESLKAPYFDGAVYDVNIPNLPFITKLVPINEGESWSLKTEQLQAIDVPEWVTWFQAPIEIAKSAGLFSESEWYPQEPVFTGPVIFIQGKPHQAFTIYPVQVNVSGVVRKLTTITYKLTRNTLPSVAARTARTYADHSVLATGEWYKLAVNSDGIFK